jgi:NAD(P)-dependent dehydrogenase (short-subunit alcohol dehydrogenase family)
MTEHRIALVTGANRGIGFETTHQLARRGWTVWLGSRNRERGDESRASLLELVPNADVRAVALDVTSDESVVAARDTVAQASGRIDILVNNAGISGRFLAPDETVPADIVPVYDVDVLGPVRVTSAFLPLLRRSDDPRLVMVSSGMGSFGITTDPERLESTMHGLAYPSSKAALNMITSQYAKSLPGIRVNAVDPGYTATDFNAHHGTQTVEQGTEAVIQACTAERQPSVFTDRHGVIPW